MIPAAYEIAKTILALIGLGCVLCTLIMTILFTVNCRRND
jgi:hypothetical protein